MAEYIDRAALDKALTIAAASGKDKDRRTWAKAICVLHDMPAADVAPVVHGRWTITEEYNDVIDMTVVKYTCSACGEYRLCGTTLSQTSYCPNCGAKMDEKEAVYD